ncbi:MAG: alpha/beta hydrolase [Sandaracinaceae bacterium]|nr:alpha/beta hydrolase [Sandaracinaceae bacterium]
MGTLKYTSLVSALWSLRGPAFFVEAEPRELSVRYREAQAPGVPPLADVFVPRARTGASVVLVHGGGFVLGSRRMKPVRFLTARLTEAGVAVCTIDYRLVFRGGRLDEAVEDVIDALRFWKARAPRFALDPARVSIAGLSAGATLSLLASAREEVHRAVSVFGLYELDHLQGVVAGVLPSLVFSSRDRKDWGERSPRQAPQPRSPTLLLHGTADGLVPVEQAYRLRDHRLSLGLPTQLVVYEGAPHGFFSAPSGVAEDAARAIARWVDAR